MSYRCRSKVLTGAIIASSVALISCSDQSQAKRTLADSATANEGAVLHIAAAANLADVLPLIIDDYQAEHHSSVQDIEVTYGSSGKLFAQIQAGAPYDLYLAANQDYPAKLVQERGQNATVQQPFTYARGQLALYSVTQSQPIGPLNQTSLTAIINSQPTSKIAIANPELAPYGASAKAYLESQQLYQDLTTQKRIIQAENIGQTFQYTHTGNVDYGFVAQSQVVAIKAPDSQFATLPADAYPPILQDGVVITESPSAADFAEYLQSEAGQQQFARAGYLPVQQSSESVAVQ